MGIRAKLLCCSSYVYVLGWQPPRTKIVKSNALLLCVSGQDAYSMMRPNIGKTSSCLIFRDEKHAKNSHFVPLVTTFLT